MLMLDLKTQSHLVDASASILRAYLRATSDTLAASAGRSWWLWAQMLGTGNPHRAALGPTGAPSPSLPSTVTWLMLVHWPWLTCGPGMAWAPWAQMWWAGPSLTSWAPCAQWRQSSAGAFRVRTNWRDPTPTPPSPAQAHVPSARDAGYASYRTAGGHAVAQVTVPMADGPADVNASVGLSPVQAMFSVWCAALRV
jgi:hypothetical protein